MFLKDRREDMWRRQDEEEKLRKEREYEKQRKEAISYEEHLRRKEAHSKSLKANEK